MTTKSATAPLAIAYVRVSTQEQANDGASLDAQVTMLTAEAERRGWDLVVKADEGYSAKNTDRPALQEALTMLNTGKAQVLMAVRLDRVSRSVGDFSGIMAMADRKRWSIALLDLSIDTSTVTGRMLANVLASMAEFERGMIGQRTKEALAEVAKEKHVGRPRTLDPKLVHRVVDMRNAGMTIAAIAAKLSAEGVPTARGGKAWSTGTIQTLLKSETARGVYIDA